MRQDFVESNSVAQLFLTLCNPIDCSTPGFPVHHQLPEPTQTHVHRVSDAIQHLILCHPLLLLPSIFAGIRWPKYWSFSFNISPSNEYSGLISFRMDWLDLCSSRDSQESSPTPQVRTKRYHVFHCSS